MLDLPVLVLPFRGIAKKDAKIYKIPGGGGAGPGGAALPPLGILSILASFLDIPLKGKRVSPKFGFTLLGFTRLGVLEKLIQSITRHIR